MIRRLLFVTMLLSLVSMVPGASAQEQAAQTGDLSVVALKEGCDGEPALRWNGSGTSIDGAIHANGVMRIEGSGIRADGPLSSACEADISGAGVRVGNVGSHDIVDSPVRFDPASVGCDFEPPNGQIDESGEWWADGGSAGGELRDGVYCADGDLTLQAAGVSGNVTLIARGADARVRIAGSNVGLRPHHEDVLIWSEGDNDQALRIDGSGSSLQGIVAAPAGGVELSQSGGDHDGALLIGDTVSLSGSGWDLSGMPIPLIAPEPEPANTGSILVSAYDCPFNDPENRKDQNWFDICLPGAEGTTFELSGGDIETRTQSISADSTARFVDVPEGQYDLQATDARWCRATSDSVNAQGKVEVTAGEESQIWIFFCRQGA